jgi:hypothetical protein
MNSDNNSAPASAQLISKAIGEDLRPGELGIVLAQAGGGKTACLTRIALDHLLRDQPVLHVGIDRKPDAIRAMYQELVNSLAVCGGDPAQLRSRIEPLRFILAYSHPTFSLKKLEQSFTNLKEQARFNPALVVLDGLDFNSATRPLVEALRSFVQTQQVPLWMCARTHRHIATANEQGVPYPCHEMADLFQVILLLKTEPKAIRLEVIKHHDQFKPKYPQLFLNPQTFLSQ